MGKKYCFADVRSTTCNDVGVCVPRCAIVIETQALNIMSVEELQRAGLSPTDDLPSFDEDLVSFICLPESNTIISLLFDPTDDSCTYRTHLARFDQIVFIQTCVYVCVCIYIYIYVFYISIYLAGCLAGWLAGF